MQEMDNALAQSSEVCWTNFQQVVYDIAKASLGKHEKKHQDWLQRAADRNDMKGFYSGLKEVWGPQTKQPVHLKSSDGLEIFTDSKSVMARWS